MIAADFLDELDRFDAAVERRAHSARRGEEESPAVGEGLTFSDYRRYTPGDDPGLVDWKLYGRTEELYIKQFEEERQATVHVLVDASASMGYGEGTTKFEYGAKLGLGFAYLTAREGNEFRFSLFGEDLQRLDAGRSSRGEVLGLVDRCNEQTPDSEAAFAQTLSAYADRIHSTALVLVVSDFLTDPAAIDAGVAALADHDVVLAHLVAPGERDPPAGGDTIFQSLESATSLRTYFGQRQRRRYADRLQAHLDDVAAVGHRLGATHELVGTDDPFFESFGAIWFA